MLACGPGNAINNVFEPEWLRMATTKTGSDGDEDDDEDDNDSKADDYDGGDGDDQFFQVQQQKSYLVRLRADKAYWRIAGSVA